MAGIKPCYETPRSSHLGSAEQQVNIGGTYRRDAQLTWEVKGVCRSQMIILRSIERDQWFGRSSSSNFLSWHAEELREKEEHMAVYRDQPKQRHPVRNDTF